MNDEEEKEDFERANKVFRDLLVETSVGYRAPAGDMSDRTLNRLVDMGFEYESTMLDREGYGDSRIPLSRDGINYQ